MNEIIRKDILAILKKIKTILKEADKTDYIELKILSNHIIHDASIFQDEDSISITIMTYALSKIIERKGFVYKKFFDCISEAILHIRRRDFENYRQSIKKFFDLIRNIDSKIEIFVEKVISQSQIKKGSNIYDHGISIGRAAEIIGISQWQLMNYIGKTRISDSYTPVQNIGTKLNFARELFNLK